MFRVLIVEKQNAVRKLIENQFDGRLCIDSTESVRTAVEWHNREPFDAVVWDSVSAPSGCFSAANTVKKFLRKPAHMRAIVLSDCVEPEIIYGRKLRCDWLQSPMDETELLAVIGTLRSDTPARCGLGEPFIPTEFEGILSFTLTMKGVVQQIIQAAKDDIPVLIIGETGTGKDLVATAIHKRSARHAAPYLPVNMGAIATELIASELFGHEKGAYTGASERRAGLFEQAEGGTVFLDEIATMDEEAQVALLRVLENKTIRRVRGEKDIGVNVRVIAATNENIEEAVKQGRFREDLYYRLDVFRIQLPPLRERAAAISMFADHFVAHFAKLYRKDIRSISRNCYQALRRHPWPGNVRELKNVIQRAVLLAKNCEVTPELLPERILQTFDSVPKRTYEPSPIQPGMTLDEVEKEYIKLTLSLLNGNKAKTACSLGICRRALYSKLKRFGML
jgi:DNA-binding NtrC family response regulator